MWSSLLSAGLSTGIDYGMQSVMANSANAKNKRAQERQFYYNNLMLDKINEYNKPINQMARLQEAGLNPNLVYANGADAQSATYGSVGMNNVVPTRMSSGFLDKMAMLNTMKQQEANIDRTDADTRAINANIDISKAELELRRLETEARIAKLAVETKVAQDESGLPAWARLFIKAGRKLGSTFDEAKAAEINTFGRLRSFGR